MKNITEQLLSESVSADEKQEIFLSMIKHIGSVGADLSYVGMIQNLLLVMQKNIKTFEEKRIFGEKDLKEYVQKYKEFQKENLKYQVWLKGSLKDCAEVEAVLKYDRVHTGPDRCGEQQNWKQSL